MSDEKHNLLQAKVEAVQKRLQSEKHVGEPALEPYRDLMFAAHDSSNGNAGDVVYLSKLVCAVSIVLTNEKLGEKQRLADAFANLHEGACLFTPLVKHTADGDIVFPFPTRDEVEKTIWKVMARSKRTATATATTSAGGEESLTVGQEGVKWTGRESVKAGGAILKYGLLIFVIWLMMGRNNKELKTELKVDRVQDIVKVLRDTGCITPRGPSDSAVETWE